jgi:hypothetical protein
MRDIRNVTAKIPRAAKSREVPAVSPDINAFKNGADISAANRNTAKGYPDDPVYCNRDVPTGASVNSPEKTAADRPSRIET